MVSELVSVDVARPRNGVRNFTAKYWFQDVRQRLTKPKRGKPVPVKDRHGKVVQDPLGERIEFDMSGKLIANTDDFGGEHWYVNELTIKAPPGVRLSGRTKAAAPLGRVEAMADALSLGLDITTRTKLRMPDGYGSTTDQVTIDHAFLHMVAQSWLWHTAQGSKNVTDDLLKESKLIVLRGDEQKARFLLVSWIRKCREEGLLPASRKRQRVLPGFEAEMAKV